MMTITMIMITIEATNDIVARKMTTMQKRKLIGLRSQKTNLEFPSNTSTNSMTYDPRPKSHIIPCLRWFGFALYIFRFLLSILREVKFNDDEKS